MQYEIIDPATEPGLSVEPIKYVRTSERQGRTHIIDRFTDGMAFTLCRMWFSLDLNPTISDSIHSKAKLCKRCQASNS